MDKEQDKKISKGAALPQNKTVIHNRETHFIREVSCIRKGIGEFVATEREYLCKGLLTVVGEVP